MDIDFRRLSTDRFTVVETNRRLTREEICSFICSLWCVWLADGRRGASVQPGAGAAVSPILDCLDSPEALLNPSVAERLRSVVDAVLEDMGVPISDRVFSDLCFACDSTTLIRHSFGDCRRITDTNVPFAQDIYPPRHCFPDGIVYGIVENGLVVSVAYAHRTGVMEDRVADIGVETAPIYRGRGFAKAVVSAVASHIVQQGGEIRYSCTPTNSASIATAMSVGFVPYGTSLIIASPCPSM